jgi:hypothetical protein
MERVGMRSPVATRVPARKGRRDEARAHAKPSQRRGTLLAPESAMTCSELRTALAAALVIGALGACSRPASQPRVVGPVIGESTAPGPANPLAPPPDAAGVTEVSAHLSGAPSPVANPAPAAGAAMPSMQSTPAQTTDTSNPATVFVPGVVTGPLPQAPATGGSGATVPANPGPGAAGPSGPGTGNSPPPRSVPPATPPRTPPLAPPNGPGSGA